MVVHHPQDDGDQPHLPQPLEFYGSGTALPTAVTQRCTAPAVAMNNVVSSDTPFSAFLSQVLVGTALGVAVPSDKVAVPTTKHPTLSLLSWSPPQGWRCTRQGMAVPSWQHPDPGNASFSSPFSPPL
jgi:hypothetical protein